MKLPLQIAFHNMPHHAETESVIRGHAQWLDNFSDRIMSCRVVVDRPHLHQKEGYHYQIRIDLKIPGRELVVKRESRQHAEHQDLEIVIREAFDEVRRQLEDHTHLQRGEVKAHEPQAHARVIKVFPAAGYGFLQTPDGREIYFHKNSVLKANFEDLTVGTEVRFVEELGDKGPQASTVTLVGRHGHL
jgi:cold shock CspA family protein